MSVGRRYAGPGVTQLGLMVLLWSGTISTETSAAIIPRAATQTTSTSIAYDAAQDAYQLTAAGASTVVFTVDLDDADLRAGMLRATATVNGGATVVVLEGAGTRYRTAADVVIEPDAAAAVSGATLTSHGIEGESVVLRWSEQPDTQPLSKTIRLSLAGSTLRVELTSDSTWSRDGYAGVSLGHARCETDCRVVQLPYLPEPVALLPNGLVMTAYVDPTVSSAVSTSSTVGQLTDGTLLAHGRSIAEPDTAGEVAPLSETAYVTVSEELWQVFPMVAGPQSPHREALSSHAVLDVWSLHRSFSGPEGVAISWTSGEGGPAHITLRYADSNATCGDGVRVVVRHGDEVLAWIPVANGAVEAQTWEGDATISIGDVLRFEVDRAGSNACDSTALQITIDTPADTFDSVADFSSEQGHRGFAYLEYAADQDRPMTWDDTDKYWRGEGAFSILQAGACHPGQGATAYLDAQNMVRRYLEYGLSNLAVIFHVWQRWGYDEGLPDHHPANPAYGSEAAMAAFVSTATAAGMLVSLHENYTDLYPDNPPDYPSPLWDPTAIALDRNGDQKLGWYHTGTLQQAFVIPSDRMLGFAQQESPLIAADYGPNSAYLDVTTGWTPARAIDHRAADGRAPTLAAAYDHTLALFDFLRTTYGGPLLGEGGEGTGRFDTYFAGFVDAVERQVEGRRHCWVAPDYELVAVKPRMLNHGMGYHSRYYVSAGHEVPSLDQVDLDQYRATELAFGHAGFLGDAISGVQRWMELHAPEYWLTQAVQQRFADAEIAAVEYHDGQRFVDLEAALRARMDLTRARVRMTYDNGLVLMVNRDGPTGGASAAGDFLHEQGHRGWTYFEVRDSAVFELAWSPEQRRWQGEAEHSFLTPWGGHPGGAEVVRFFEAPLAATIHVEGSAEDQDLSCGDGVTVRVTHNFDTVWRCDLPGDVTAPCGELTLDLAVAEGDLLGFWIAPRENNWCDSTIFYADLSWSDTADHDWVVDTPEGPRRLPPSGFFAHDDEGLRASTARLTASPASPVVDQVLSEGYDFVSSRDLAPRTIGRFRSDGAIAVVQGPHGEDLHALQLTDVRRDGQLLLASSVRADLNLRFADAREAVLTAREIVGDTSTTVTWGALPSLWQELIARDPGGLSLTPVDDHGTPIGTPRSVTLDHLDRPVLTDLVADRHYLLRVVAPSPPDAGAEAGVDAGATVDAGRDSGDGRDAGVEGDSGSRLDAGIESDRGDGLDVGAEGDSGEGADAEGSSPGDAGAGPRDDLGVATPAPGESGCSCRATRSAAPPLFLVGVLAAIRRRAR